jgi:protein O-mannosyl-transferase
MAASKTGLAKAALAKGTVPSEARSFRQGKLCNPRFLCLGLALLTLAVYLPAGRNDFVNYDDSDYVTENAHVKSGLTWETVVWAFKTGHASNWHPVTWLSHALDCQVFGVKPGPMHLVSVGFHVVDTLLVFLVLCALTGEVWRSALVAALFGLHPLHVESVAWVSERKDVLSALFFLLTLMAYGKYGRDVTNGAWRGTGGGPQGMVDARRSRTYAPLFYGLALLCFALGLMSKPMLVTTAFVLLLLDYWPLGRLREHGSSQGQTDQTDQTDRTGQTGRTGSRSTISTAFYLVVEKLPFFALSLASSVVTFRVQRWSRTRATSARCSGRTISRCFTRTRGTGRSGRWSAARRCWWAFA